MRTDLWPRPLEVHPVSGEVRLARRVTLSVPAEFAPAAQIFAEDLAVAAEQSVEMADPAAAAIEIRRVEHGEPEGYRVDVGERIVVEASTLAGVAHGLTTLRQLGPDSLFSLGHGTPEWSVPRGLVVDRPRFAWRGAHLDVARHFFDVEVVERFIDLLALHRFNRLHLHLNDDQGWRVEVPGWPRLTEVGAWRRSSPVGHEREGRDDGTPHGGFYRATDLQRLAARARARGIVIVPEIDLPGHAQAVLAAYPEFGSGEPAEVWTRWGISRRVLAPSRESLAFAEEVVGYVASLFPGSPVHIGGDECPTEEWESSPVAEAAMSEHGLLRARDLQGLFTTRLAERLRDDGHETLAWDEVLDAAVPEGTVVVAWRSEAKGLEALERGLEVVMAPMEYTYFDWPNSPDPSEPVAQTPPSLSIPWEKVYGWGVLPPGADPESARRVRGGQGQLWSEYIATPEHLDYMAFPRLSALAEVLWGTAGSLEGARERLGSHLGRLRARGVNFRPLDS